MFDGHGHLTPAAIYDFAFQDLSLREMAWAAAHLLVCSPCRDHAQAAEAWATWAWLLLLEDLLCLPQSTDFSLN